MTLKVRVKGGVSTPSGGLFAGGLFEEPVHDAENTSVDVALGRVGDRYGVRLVRPVDALARAVDGAADVFTAWLEHGDAAGNFETDLLIRCDAEALVDEAAREAKDIYDILGEGVGE